MLYGKRKKPCIRHHISSSKQEINDDTKQCWFLSIINYQLRYMLLKELVYRRFFNQGDVFCFVVFLENMYPISNKLNTWVFFNRDLNRSCLVYMFSLRFSGSKFLIHLRRQFRVRKIFSCTFKIVCVCVCLKLPFRKCVTWAVGRCFIKTCSLTGCQQALLF